MTVPRLVLLTVLAAGSLALAGCVPSNTTPSPTVTVTAPGTPSPSASVTPSPSAAAASLPTDCKNIVSPSVYAATFGDTPLNDPGSTGLPASNGQVTPSTPDPNAAPEDVLGAAVQLQCLWRYPQADITYLQATFATVDPALARSYLDSLDAEGYTCAAKNGGQQCQLIKPDEQYPVDDGYTYLLRGSIYITVSQANYKTNNLMGSIVEQIWN